MGRALLVLETPQDRQKAISWINKAPVGTRVEFKASKRSLPQNDRLWAMLTDVQAHMKRKGVDYNTDQWKVIFLHAWGKEVEFLPGLDGKTFVPYGQSSSDLSKDEMTSLIEFMMAWGAEQGVTFHDQKQPNSDGATDASRSDDAAPSPSASSEPADDPAPSAGSTSSEPSLFGKFDFGPGELVHLKDFARKALDEADGGNDAPAKVQFVERMFLDYLDAVSSESAKNALRATGVPVHAVIDRNRTRAQAADYIARDVLGCKAEELEGRRNG
jgi:hypothetical protein